MARRFFAEPDEILLLLSMLSSAAAALGGAPATTSTANPVIGHNGKTVAYRASASEVSVAGFYADCRHEVKPVRTGYRVTLSCNLLLERRAA